jgi:hypothetical protein
MKKKPSSRDRSADNSEAGKTGDANEKKNLFLSKVAFLLLGMMGR